MCNISIKIFTVGVIVSLSAFSVQSTSAIEGLLKGTHYAAKKYLPQSSTLSNLQPKNVIRAYGRTKDNVPVEITYLEPLHPVALEKILQYPISKNVPFLNALEIKNFRPIEMPWDTLKRSLIYMPDGNRLGVIELNAVFINDRNFLLEQAQLGFRMTQYEMKIVKPRKIKILSHNQLNGCPLKVGRAILEYALRSNKEEISIIFTRNLDLFSNYSKMGLHLHEQQMTQKSSMVQKDKNVHIIEVNKFKKKEEELENLKDHFYYFLKHAPYRTTPHKGAPKPIIDMYKLLQSSNWDSKEIAEYGNTEETIFAASMRFNLLGVDPT